MPSAKNFGYSLVATAPSPATSGTSLVVTAADGTKFPAVPFNATVWPVAVRPTTANAEIVTVTAISTDTLTIVRAQEGSSARTIVIGDQIAATITANVMVQSSRFNPVTAATQDIVLDASNDFTVSDTHEVGAGYSLEVPATSTLEPVPVVKQAEVQSYFGIYDFIESGCVWTADSAGSTLNGTMSEGYVWIGGRRLKASAVKSRAFTASTDTYVDFSDNGNGTAKLIYTETTNNVAAGSPTLAPGSLRNAIIVTAAGSIAASTSINQGQESIVVPIVSSIPYAVTDSLGNLICPRDPARKVLGYRQLVANATVASASDTQITGLTVPVIVPTNRKVKVFFYSGFNTQSNAGDQGLKLWDGAVGATTIQFAKASFVAGVGSVILNIETTVTPTSASKTYNISASATVGTLTVNASSTNTPFIKVELA